MQTLVSWIWILLWFGIISQASHTSCEHKVETNSRFISATTTTTTTTAAATATTTTSAPTITSSTTTPHAANTNVNSGSVSHYAEPTDTVASSQTMTTYSLLDQSILNWQSIQDWAQRQWVKRQQSTRSSAVSVKTNAQPSTQPCPTQPVQHTLLAGALMLLVTPAPIRGCGDIIITDISCLFAKCQG